MTKKISLCWGIAGSLGLALAGCAMPGGAPDQFGQQGPRAPHRTPLAALWNDASPQGLPPGTLPTPKVRHPGRLQLKYAQWQEQEGNHAVARAKYERVLADDPKSADALVGLARLDQLAGRIAQAEDRFSRALALRPQDPQALAAAAQFYADQERWDKAVELLRAATAANPEQSSYRFQLAVALTRSGDVQSALPHFGLTVGEAEAHYNVAHLLHEQGQLEDAERHLLRAVARKPSLSEAHELLDRLHRDRAVMLADRHSLPDDSGPSPAVRAGTGRRGPALQTAQTRAEDDAPPFVLPARYPAQEEGRPAGSSADSFVMPARSAADGTLPRVSPQQREQWANQAR